MPSQRSAALDAAPGAAQAGQNLLRWLQACLALYLAFSWQITDTVASDATFFFSLAAMLPLAAAWAVDRFGPGAVAPVAALSLLPSLGVQTTDWLSTGFWPPTPALLLLGVVGGGWHAARRQPWLWDGLHRPTRLWWVLPAFCLLTLVRYEMPPVSVFGAGFGVGINPFGAVAMGLLVAIVDWRVLAQRTHELMRGQAPWVLPLVGRLLPVALTVGFALLLSFGVGGLRVGWGGASAEALAVALAFVVLLTGAVPWRHCLAVAAALFAVEALRFAAVARPLGMLFSEAKYAGTPHDLAQLACDLVCAMLLARVLRAHAVKLPRDAMRFAALALLAIVVMQFGVKPAIQPPWSGAFRALAPGGWLVGGAAFAAALRAGGSALVAAPLLLAAAAAAGAAAFGRPDAGPMPAVVTAVGVATVVAMHSFLGWLIARRQEARPAAASGHDDRVDIGRLAAFVHRLDTSATLRSFGALLAVAGGGLVLAKLGVFAMLWQRLEGFGDGETGELALAVCAVLFVALQPLGFIVVDAINRRDRLRPLAALSGALLAAVAAALAVVGAAAGFNNFSINAIPTTVQHKNGLPRGRQTRPVKLPRSASPAPGHQAQSCHTR